MMMIIIISIEYCCYVSDLVLLGAAGGGALGELGALVGEAGVRAVGVVPEPGVLGVVVPASSRYTVPVLECGEQYQVLHSLLLARLVLSTAPVVAFTSSSTRSGCSLHWEDSSSSYSICQFCSTHT